MLSDATPTAKVSLPEAIEQFKADLEAVSIIKQDGRDDADHNLIKDAEAMPGELAANIMSDLPEARHKLPYMRASCP